MAICTGCGNDTGDLRICPRCGAPQDAGAAASSARPDQRHGASSGPWLVFLAIIGLLALLVAIPVALRWVVPAVLPRSEPVTASEAEAGAVQVLSRIRALELAHHARHGRYTDNLDDPSAPGFLEGYEDAATPYYLFAVSRATETELCVDARPTAQGAEARMSGQSVDAEGRFYGSTRCGERMELN